MRRVSPEIQIRVPGTLLLLYPEGPGTMYSCTGIYNKVKCRNGCGRAAAHTQEAVKEVSKRSMYPGDSFEHVLESIPIRAIYHSRAAAQSQPTQWHYQNIDQ